MSQTVKCDKCGKPFSVALSTINLPGGVRECFYRCPHCKEKYVAFYTDKAIRKLQARQRAITAEIKQQPAGAVDRRDKLLTEFDDNKRRIKELLDALRIQIAARYR